MKFLSTTPLTTEFLDYALKGVDRLNIDQYKLLELMVIGDAMLEKPTLNTICEEAIDCLSKSESFRTFHEIPWQMPKLLQSIVKNLQEEKQLTINPNGWLITDEHIEPCTSKKMEGVSYEHSTMLKTEILSRSFVHTQYLYKDQSLPLGFSMYRAKEECTCWNEHKSYHTKSELARGLWAENLASTNPLFNHLFDCGYWSRENIMWLQDHSSFYVSRPNAQVKGTYHKRAGQTLEDIFEQIPDQRFRWITMKNRKTKKKRRYRVAIADVFYAQIGTQRLVFINCGKDDLRDDVIEEHAEASVGPSGRRFRVFATNHLDWDACRILETYTERWPVETFFRDLGQNFHLIGGFWPRIRDYEFQLTCHCLTTIFFNWAARHHKLDQYNKRIATIGQRKQAFQHYCQDLWTRHVMNLEATVFTHPEQRYLLDSLYLT